ncbi:MAG TPA: ComF family protein, partial [Bacteroidetes bacterium]|nr:ComF family protein [Bacteroidota bacterium]
HYKFAHGLSLAEPLAEHLARRCVEARLRFPRGVLVPVPDHPSRRRERGYSPSGRLAAAFADHVGLPCRPELARRLHAGPHQSKLSDEERRKVPGKAFAVQPPDDPDMVLVLFDDVIHTGTTLKRLAQAARKAGWKRIEAVCLCS